MREGHAGDGDQEAHDDGDDVLIAEATPVAVQYGGGEYRERSELDVQDWAHLKRKENGIGSMTYGEANVQLLGVQ